MHVPQSVQTATELKYLASVLRQIISPRTNSPIIQIFQDTLTGSYRISQPGVQIPEHIAMNLMSRMRKPISGYIRKNKNLTGAEVISTTFPLINHEGRITIKDGQLVKGVLKKGAFGAASEGIIHVIYNELGPERCGQFINDVQAVVTKYNLYAGFSVGASDLIAPDGIRDSLGEGRKRVSDILSSMHSGTFLNNSGRTDGEELENQIVNALKEVSSKISEKSMESLPRTNRMLQMVDSGSKGSDLNITQMMGLLGQQMIAGKRIQYTLQDRTLPHFPKYDDGIESRGFVENSFITGLRPAEFFFHAMGGREGLIDTAVKTSDSGYIQRKLVKMMEDLHIEQDGTVRNVNGNIIQFKYGGDGIDSTCIEVQPCELGIMTLEQVYKMFAASKADFDAVCAEKLGDDTPTTLDMVDEIIADRDMLVRNVFRFVKKTEIYAPVHLKRLTEKYRNPYSVKTDLTAVYVGAQLTALCAEEMISHNKVFHILLRYYLAPKRSIIDLRLTKEMFDELLRDIRFRYMKSKVHVGEMVGTLAAQSVGEPTTQLTLNTFHSAGTVKANATQGVPRIIELLSVSHNPKNPGNTVYLTTDIASSQDAAISKMKEVQKTTLRDITKSVRIYYDPSPTSMNTSVRDDVELLKSYERFSLTQEQTCSSPWVMRLEFDRMELAARNIMDMTLIQTKIMNNKVLKVFECIHSDTNTPDKLVMRITFGNAGAADVAKNPLSLRFIEDKLLDTVLTGIDNIGRVYPREIQKELVYDEKVAGYSSVKQYVLDVEGSNLLDLALVSGTDPYRTFSNDIHEIMEVFGIETARVCMFEEFMEVFTAEYVNYHHMITLIDNMTYPGFILSVDRFGMKKGDAGILSKASFEETSKILFDGAISAEYDSMKGVSAAIMFGQCASIGGTGSVEILIDETRLDENAGMGMEPIAEAHDESSEVVDTQMCKLQDVMMEW